MCACRPQFGESSAPRSRPGCMSKPISSGRIVPIHRAGRWCAPWMGGLALLLAGCQHITPEAVVAATPAAEAVQASEALTPTVSAPLEVSATITEEAPVTITGAPVVELSPTLTVAAVV